MSGETVACRRCADCIGSSHHWTPNPDFGNDPAEAEGPTNVTHLCKHCPATGSACEECYGGGRGEVSGYDRDGNEEFDNCPVCHGEGVVVGATLENGGWEPGDDIWTEEDADA